MYPPLPTPKALCVDTVKIGKCSVLLAEKK